MRIKKEVNLCLDEIETDRLFNELDALFHEEGNGYVEDDFPKLFLIKEHLIRYKRQQS